MLAAYSLANPTATAAGSNSASERFSASLMAHLFRSAVTWIAGAECWVNPRAPMTAKAMDCYCRLTWGWVSERAGPEGLAAEGSFALKLCGGQAQRLASLRVLSDGFQPKSAADSMTSLYSSDAAQSAPLAHRVALVTGASRGIGRAVALELAR